MKINQLKEGCVSHTTGDKATKALGGKKTNLKTKLGESTVTEAEGTNYLMVGNTLDPKDKQRWSIFFYPENRGNNHVHLKKVLNEHAAQFGWGVQYDVITQWRGDIDEALATAQEQLDGGNLISGYEMDLRKKVRTLTKAKEIMFNLPEAKAGTEEAVSFESVKNRYAKAMNGTSVPPMRAERKAGATMEAKYKNAQIQHKDAKAASARITKRRAGLSRAGD